MHARTAHSPKVAKPSRAGCFKNTSTARWRLLRARSCAPHSPVAARADLAQTGDDAWISTDSTMAHPWHPNEISDVRTILLLPSKIARGAQAFGDQHLLVTTRDYALPPAEHRMITREHQDLTVDRPLHRSQKFRRYRIPQLRSKRIVGRWRGRRRVMPSRRHIPSTVSLGEPTRSTAALRRSADGCRYRCDDVGLACPINI